jgi:hypothetical protein
MAQCAFCKAETELYDGGAPICIECSRERERAVARQARTALIEGLAQATARAKAASAAFQSVMGEMPSGAPHPDGVQRIHNVSHELSAARKEMMTAHSRLNDFLSRGIVPEDLKRRS